MTGGGAGLGRVFADASQRQAQASSSAGATPRALHGALDRPALHGDLVGQVVQPHRVVVGAPASGIAASQIANEEQPPRRFVAGPDAIGLAKQKFAALQEQIDAYRDLSTALAYDDTTAGVS